LINIVFSLEIGNIISCRSSTAAVWRLAKCTFYFNPCYLFLHSSSWSMQY